jgi:hypothetical protein
MLLGENTRGSHVQGSMRRRVASPEAALVLAAEGLLDLHM